MERLVFPGGCFFASLLAEMDARSGTIHDMVRTGAGQWLAMLEEMAAEARERGEIRSEVEVSQLAFELDSALELANYYYGALQGPGGARPRPSVGGGDAGARGAARLTRLGYQREVTTWARV